MINHTPLFETDKVEKHYSEKDGVPVKYVCTSALGNQDFAVDVYYRETPHPEFGNRYFGLYRNMYAAGSQICITSADVIEDLEFNMIKDKEGVLHYSAHRHDCKIVDDFMIDGGRAYFRAGGKPLPRVYGYKVKDGEFYEL